MYNPINKQYIFKQSSDKVWNFYYDEKPGLCYCLLNKRNSWTDSISLQKNISPPFFIDMDETDCFHILFQDKQGNLFYSHLDDDRVKTVPILNSKFPSTYNKHLFLVPLKKDVIHFFYKLHSKDAPILVHQTLTGGTVSVPKVIDYITDSEFPYSLVYDKSGGIYAFYQCSDGKHLQLGYKKLNISQGYWGEFTPITRFQGDSEFPRAIIDNMNVIHICYQRRYDKNFELVYQQKIPDKNIWTPEIVIHSSIYPFNNASILRINQNTIVYWIRDNVIYYSSSSDGGNTWSKPVKYNFESGKQLMCMAYKTNSVYESDKIAATSIPGNYMNGYKLAFYQESTRNASNLSPDDFKNMILDGFKLLKESVEDLKESNTALKDSIASLNLAHRGMEKDLTKYAIKVSLLENEINLLKNGSKKTDSIKNGTASTEMSEDNFSTLYAKSSENAAIYEKAIIPQNAPASSGHFDTIQAEDLDFSEFLTKKRVRLLRQNLFRKYLMKRAN